MRKILAVLLAIVLVFSLAACGKGGSNRGGKVPGPEDTVSAFCDAVKAFDINAVKSYLKNGSAADDVDLSTMPQEFLDLMKGWAKEIKYKVGAPETGGTDSKVHVDFTYVDASPVLKEAMTSYITKALSMALSGETSEEAMTKLLLQCLKDAQKTAKTGTKDAGVDFYLEQVDGKWLIKDAPQDLLGIMLSNMSEGLSGLFGDLLK